MDDRAILLVEDNPDDVLLTRRALRKSGIQNRVSVARDGAEALDLLFGCGDLPCLVLLDVKLPKVDGLEVLRRLRAEERTRELPVAVLISREETRPPDDDDSVGRADVAIDKGVDYDAFLRAVRRLKELLAEARNPGADGRGRFAGFAARGSLGADAAS